MLSDGERRLLLDLARRAVESAASGTARPVPGAEPVFGLRCGAFVTLKKDGRLRGCIGSFAGTGSLGATVVAMAAAAATGDPRFRPVTPSEVGSLAIQISVLSEMRPADASEVIPGVHGVYVRRGRMAGTLLPQVAREEGWDRDTLLEHACLKAGLPSGAWKHEGTEILVYTAEVFPEMEERNQ